MLRVDVLVLVLRDVSVVDVWWLLYPVQLVFFGG